MPARRRDGRPKYVMISVVAERLRNGYKRNPQAACGTRISPPQIR